MQHGPRQLQLVSVYGWAGEGAGPRNRDLLGSLHNEACKWGQGSHLIIGGDWNMYPGQCSRAGVSKLGTLLVTGAPTCFPGGGRDNRELDMWLVGGT